MNNYTTIRVNTSKQYDVLVCNGSLAEIGAVVANQFDKCRIAILTDDIVNSLYADTVTESLQQNGFSCAKYIFPNGEKSKNINYAEATVKIMSALNDVSLAQIDALAEELSKN